MSTKGANKENLMSDLSAHLALHAERMKLLKRAEEGLEKLSADPFIARSSEPHNEKQALTRTQIIKSESVITEEKQKSKLPVSPARQRRRDKQGGKSKIQIKNYRPGYTWNKGGRVKELRIRCLARKFLQIWKRKVFGRVLPQEARKHYQEKIKKDAFREWYDMWWHVRKEWRLMVRAECHFRYLAWTKHFEAWKEFIRNKKSGKERKQIAIRHDTQLILRNTMNHWKFFTSSQREKKKKKAVAFENYENSLLKKCWQRWKEGYDLKQYRKNMNVIALQFWAYRIQVQHWLIWCEAFKRRQVLHSKERLAVRHNKFYTMQRALTAWMNYWKLRKEKQAEKEYAQLLYHRSLLVRSMRVWVNRFNRRMTIHNHQAHIEELADRFTKRRYLHRWIEYINIQHEKDRKQDLAIEYYCRKLKVVGFSAFRLHLVQQRMKEMQTKMAANFYVTMLTRRYWNRWMARCEHNEELAIHSLTVKSLMHYRMVICRKLLDAWLDYVEWRKHRQAQYDKADAYYYVRAMPVFLGHIKAHVELQKRNKQYAEMAVGFRRENLSARFFYMWYNNFEQSREDRMNERMAILHNEDCMIRRYFSHWKNKCAEAIEESQKQEQADQYFNAVLCKKHLKALKHYLDEIKMDELNDVKATKHHYKHQLSIVFNTWKQFVSGNRQQKVKKNRADMFYRRHVYQKVIKKLKSNLIQGRQFRQIAEVHYNKKCHQLLRSVIQRWRESCEEQKETRESEKIAICHYHRCLLYKVATVWHRYAVIHAYKKSETRQWVENVQKKLNDNKLQRYFSFWKESRDRSLLNRLKTEQATQHYNRVILQQLIDQWKQFVTVSVKKKLLMKQCVWFNEIRLKTWVLSEWKREHDKTEDMARKSALALWHWSLSLQKQVLIALYIYTQERKRKKNRINQALERRHARLIKNGVSQWISVANDLSALRAKFAAQQHATKAFTLHQIVQKCAIHWRQWTARRRSQRGTKGDLFVTHVIKPRAETLVRPVPNIPHSQPAEHATHGSSKSSGSYISRELVPEKLVPLVSSSPVVSKGMLPEGVPGKRVEFQLDGNLPSRRKPRHPSFLAESLKRAGLFSVQQDIDGSDEISQKGRNEIEEKSLSRTHSAKRSQETSVGQDYVTITKSDSSDLEVSPTAVKKNDCSLGAVGCESSGQTSGLTGSTSTLQVRDFPTEDKTQVHLKNLTRLSEKTLSSVTSDHDVDKKSYIPQQGYKTFETKLLTPADFLATKMTSTLNKDMIGNLPLVGLSPREGERIDGISSINSTLKTKESVDLLSSGNNSTKIKDSIVFVKSTDDTTPRSGDSLLPINIDSPREEKKGTVLANQITDIRNRLKGFNEKKKKLRRLQKQHNHLIEWLEKEDKHGTDIEREDIKKEVTEIECDMKRLNQEINIEKPMCAKLVSEVQILVKLLQGSETS